MKRGATIGFAGVLGCVIAFWLFGLAFTRSTSAFNLDSIIPLFLGFVGCLSLVFFAEREKMLIILGIISPSFIIFGLLFLALLMEGNVDWGHLIIIVKVMAAASFGLIIALLLKHMLKKNKDYPV